MKTITLEAELRTNLAKAATKALRQAGKVPAVLYHKGDETLSIAIKEIPLRKLIYTSESHIVNLKLDNGSERQAIVKTTDFDPVSDKIIHIDFLGLRADETVDVDVPTLFKGSPAGALKGGRVQAIMHKVTVRCLPADIPDHIELDVTPLEVGESLHISDANAKVEGGKYRIIGDEKQAIVSVVSLTKAEEPVAVAAVAAEPEVIKKGKKEEEAPAADAKKADAKKK